ncbi:MAG: preprotein translocase subunit SecG [Proteobacteria bacterium]|nr:preprotein translocase subunit SecG [Pseudomonadota bacterium]
MSTFETVLLMLLVLDALALTALVLLQQGRGADVGAAFGSGSANTMLGSSGTASFLTKVTAWLAIGFFIISFGLAYAAKERAENVEGVGIPQLAAPEEPELTEESEGVDSDIPDV